MGKTHKHEKTWGSRRRPHDDDYDEGWDEMENNGDYTIEDFFGNTEGMRIWCSECGYVDSIDLAAIDTRHNKAQCPECGGCAEIVYE